MNEPKMNLLARFSNSIMNFKAYSVFIQQRFAKSFVYLLILSLFFGLIVSIRLAINYNQTMTSVEKIMEAEIPEFVLSNGKLEVEGEMPIQLGDEYAPIFIDTTGNTDESVLEGHANGIFIGEDRMVQKNFGRIVRITHFDSFGPVTLSKALLIRMFTLFRLGIILIFIFFPIYFWAERLFYVLVLSVLGLLTVALKGVNLRYTEIFKMSIYAQTLPAILAVILSVAQIKLVYFFPIYVAISFLYFWNALGALRENKPETN